MLLRSKYFFYTFFFITSCVFSQQFRNASNYSDVNIYQDNNGVAVADYDLDGDLDIFIVGSFSEENNDFILEPDYYKTLIMATLLMLPLGLELNKH